MDDSTFDALLSSGILEERYERLCSRLGVIPVQSDDLPTPAVSEPATGDADIHMEDVVDPPSVDALTEQPTKGGSKRKVSSKRKSTENGANGPSRKSSRRHDSASAQTPAAVPNQLPQDAPSADQEQIEHVDLTFQHLRLRLVDDKGKTVYKPVEDLPDDDLDHLRAWWAKIQTYGSDRDSWEKFGQADTKCCGNKVITKGPTDTHWPQGKFACKSCTQHCRPHRPCMRLVYLGESGDLFEQVGLDRVVEILPNQKKSGMEGFEYWGAPQQ